MGFEKNCKIEEFTKMNVLNPYSIIENELSRFKDGVVDF